MKICSFKNKNANYFAIRVTRAFLAYFVGEKVETTARVNENSD